MKKWLIVVAVVVISVIGFGYFQYQQLENGSAASQSLSALSTAFSAGASGVDADISQVNQLLSILDQVSSLAKLDVDLFTMPSYVLLRDFSVTLYPAQSVGRTNPFLAIDESVQAAPQPPRNTQSQQNQNSGSLNQEAGNSNASANSQVDVQESVTLPQNIGTQAPITDTSGDVQINNNSQNQDPVDIVISPNQSNTPTGQAADSSQDLPPDLQCDPFTDPACFDALFGN